MLFKAIWKPLAITSQVANQQWQARWNERDAADAERQLQLARADADRAADIAGGLRTSIAQLRRQLADSETGRLSATAQVSAARASASVLLADVLSESVRRNEELAAYADRARASNTGHGGGP